MPTGVFTVKGGLDFCFQAVVPGHLPSEAIHLRWLSAPENGPRTVDLVVGPPGAVMAGRVVDEVGAPVPGAVVMAGPPGRISGSLEYSRRPSPVTTRTDAEGRFTYPAALPEGDQRIAVFKEGFATASIVRTVGTEALHCDVVLERGVTIQGRVLDVNGHALPLASVYLSTAGTRFHEHRFGLRHGVKADEDGRYTLHAVPSGTHELRARSLHQQVLVRGAAALTVSAQAEMEHDVVASEGMVIAGRVIDEFGTPVPDLRVRAEDWIGNSAPRGARTDADGRFRLTCLPSPEEQPAGLPPGWTVEVRGGAGRPAPLLARLNDVAVNTVDLEVTVARPATEGATLVGRLVHPSGPLPPNAVLFLYAAEKVEHEWQAGSVNVSYDLETGAFSEGPLAPGLYRLVLRAPEQGELASLAGILVEDAGTVDVGDIQIGGGGSMNLTVHMDLPEMIPAEMLPQILNEQRLVLDGFGRRVKLTRTETGWVTPNPLQAGEWTLRLTGGELMVLPPTPITLVEGETTERTIEAMFGMPVRVLVQLDPNADWSRASLRYYDDTGAELARHRSRPKSDLDENGQLGFGQALPAGVIRIDLWVDGERQDASTTVTVPEELVPVDEVLLDGR